MDLDKYIEQCFELAKKGGRDVLPNPLVGCVIVKNGKIISKGYHEKFGGYHAERNAILNCKENLEGAELFVNLEPCSHFGKTPPCTDLIIKSGIKKVVFAMHDVNPDVRGEEILKAAGIEVKGGVLEDKARELNKVFIKNMKRKLPYIALKTATTLDSKVATINYNSKWITGEVAREEVMRLRSRYQAILTGSNTVKLDNPKLTSRIEGGINPARIVIDRKGKLKLRSNVFKNDGTRVIAVDNSDKKYPKHIEKIPFKNFKTLFKTLFEMGIYSIMVEAGSKLNSLLIKEKFVDEVYQFVAPKILGGGYNFVSSLDPVRLTDAIGAGGLTVKQFGEDILLNYKLVYDKKG